MPEPAKSLRWFYALNLGVPALVACAVFLAFDLTELDIRIANLFWNPQKHVFIWQASYFVEKYLHVWAREIPNGVGYLSLAGGLLSLFWGRLKPYRRDLFFVFIAMALSSATISGIKRLTDVECPLGVYEYGGDLPHMHWWQLDKVPGLKGKRCWPAGHATGGFVLMALYFAVLRHRRRLALWLLVFGIAMGHFYGASRMLQGWHFMSHTLWSGIIVWVMIFLTALVFYGQETLRRAQFPGRAISP